MNYGRVINTLSIIVIIGAIIWFFFDFTFEPPLVAISAIILFLQTAKGSLLPLPVAKEPTQNGYKLIVFDLDGTLLRGKDFKYSWKRIWEYLELPDTLRRKYYNDFYERKIITYDKWCEICVKEFKKKGVSRADFKEITNGISATKNLKEAIETLKFNGFITAIVSGGVDTFLEELIPNHEELFDYIFINKLIFDQQDRLFSVIPTPYDFDKKLDAIKLICKERKIKLGQVVFVGEGRNDEGVFSAILKSGSGFSIAYPGNESSIEHTASVVVEEDDLYQVINVIPL